MSYTGDVTVGGPADTRELPGLTITKVAVGPMDNNAYLLRCTQTGALALIDAANDAATALRADRRRARWPPLSPPTSTGTTGGARSEVAAGHGRGHRRPPQDAGEIPVPTTDLVGTATGGGGQRDAVGDPPARAHAGQHRAAL